MCIKFKIFFADLVTKTVVRETKSDRGPTTGSGTNILSSTPRVPSSTVSTPEDEYIPMSTDRPSGLDFDDFLPVRSSHYFLIFFFLLPLVIICQV